MVADSRCWHSRRGCLWRWCGVLDRRESSSTSGRQSLLPLWLLAVATGTAVLSSAVHIGRSAYGTSRIRSGGDGGRTATHSS